MSTKTELQLMLKAFGYDLNPNTSKHTLVNLLHLHSKALKEGIDVSKIDDHQLRYYLNEYNIYTGPIVGHTRIIYQRQLLEAINNEITQVMNDEVDDNNATLCTRSVNPEDGIVKRNGKIVAYNIQ